MSNINENNTNKFEKKFLSSSVEGTIGSFKAAIDKMKYSFLKQINLGVLGGAILALAYVACISATLGVKTAGISNLINGVIFPAGIVLITFLGGGLYTSHVVAVIPTIRGAVKFSKFLYGIFGVFIGNFIGTGIIALLIYSCGLFDNGQAFASAAFNLATHKMYGFGTYLNKNGTADWSLASKSMLACFASGILCNLLVSATLPATYSTKSDTTKIMLLFFLILFFIASGFQHSPANTFVFWILFFESITKVIIVPGHFVIIMYCFDFLTINIIFSFIGNFIGGGLLTPGILYVINREHMNNIFNKN
ncbi:formate/nitrite transporter family protein [Spiroplasma endosymbiont of Aspidapion aeneum]|uniref:formate/nitrite transporter family protein n=1 Tax=Spiroplasma endosymbiont of Aspidapion aeneum TaxID=3066276 RepID=UPI00313D019F